MANIKENTPAEDPHTEKTVGMYDAIPGVFAGHFAGFRSTVPDIELAHNLAAVPLGESQVVEIGCGDGRDAEAAFVPNSAAYTGYDPSRGLLEIARARFPGARADMFQVGYAQTTDYPEDTDIMMAVNSVLHVPKHDLPAMYEHVRSGLRLGGIFYAITKVEDKDNTEVYHDEFEDSNGNKVTGERVFYHHSTDTLGGLAVKAGLEVVYSARTPIEAKPWDWYALGLAKA
jgi:predicted TPR repeat methyltransferase